MQALALKLLFQSLIVLLGMEFSLKKNPTCLASLLLRQGQFIVMELKMTLDSQCDLLVKRLEDISQKSCLM